LAIWKAPDVSIVGAALIRLSSSQVSRDHVVLRLQAASTVCFAGRYLLVLVRILSPEEALYLNFESGVNVLKIITARDMNQKQRRLYFRRKGIDGKTSNLIILAVWHQPILAAHRHHVFRPGVIDRG
jgi:hypothetical protein